MGWFYLVIFFICSSFNCWDHGQFAKIYICCLNKSQDPKSWCIYHSNNFSMWHCSCNSFSSLDGSYQSVLWSLLATTIIPELTRITESRATTIYSGIRVGICIISLENNTIMCHYFSTKLNSMIEIPQRSKV